MNDKQMEQAYRDGYFNGVCTVIYLILLIVGFNALL